MANLAKTIGLLLCSNVFMTAAWYGHLRWHRLPIATTILASWGLAFFEYALQVPANRIGYEVASAYQLKIIQEAITFLVFGAFVWLWLGELPQLRYGISAVLMIAAVAIAFA